ncbi:MAG TPA: chemotaxis protein CheD [Longimicrobium sp.]|jgi:chemotaxis protein CheD|uniref:chemotaxis protein CheD n=1 Tax=Longimicrobium sp. TaxID=2029185 RepID=UPI002EDA477E
MSALAARASAARPEPAAAPVARRAVYLHPGHVVVSGEPAAVTTILGSCVSVCLWDARLRVGGMNHFLLPNHAGMGTASARFGCVAMRKLLDGMRSLGCRTADLDARVIGGACVVEAFRGTGEGHLGDRNAELALQALEHHGIRVTRCDVGGHRGRKLLFHTDEGTAAVRLI